MTDASELGGGLFSEARGVATIDASAVDEFGEAIVGAAAGSSSGGTAAEALCAAQGESSAGAVTESSPEGSAPAPAAPRRRSRAAREARLGTRV